MPVVQAELSRAGEYVGVVTLTEDGVMVELEDPVQQDHVELVFREAGPVEQFVGRGEPGEIQWRDSSHFADRMWFEKVLESLASEGYDFHLTKTDSG
jgi:hypothetical protein